MDVVGVDLDAIVGEVVVVLGRLTRGEGAGDGAA